MTHSTLTPLAIDQIRRDFDASFRTAVQSVPHAPKDYLVIGMCNVRYAVALNDVASLQADVRVTPLPSRDPRFLGLCGVRSEVLAVYDLGACLGHETSRSWRWVARVSGTSLAFAFAELHCQTRLARAREGSVAKPSLELADGKTVPQLNLAELARAVLEQNRLDVEVQPKEPR
jgi:CheW-like domain